MMSHFIEESRSLLSTHISEALAHLAPSSTSDEDVANAQRASLNECCGNCTESLPHACLDDHALAGAVRVGFELEHLGLEQDLFADEERNEENER